MANNNVVDRAILAFTSGLERLPEKLIGLRWVILAFFAAFTATTSYGIQSLTIDQSLDIWFDEDDDTLGVYRVFRRVFGGDENIVVLYRVGDGDVFSPESLQQVRALENKLNRLRTEPDSQLDRIVEVQSLLSVDVLESDGDTLLSRPLIGKTLPQTKDEVEAIRKRAQSVRDLEGSFFSADFKYGLLIIRTDVNARLIESDANEDQADEGLEAGGDDFDFDFDEVTTKSSPPRWTRTCSLWKPSAKPSTKKAGTRCRAQKEPTKKSRLCWPARQLGTLTLSVKCSQR